MYTFDVKRITLIGKTIFQEKIVEMFFEKEYDTSYIIYKKKKGGNGWPLPNPLKSTNLQFYPNQPYNFLSGYFTLSKSIYFMWFGFWFWPNETQTDPCTPLCETIQKNTNIKTLRKPIMYLSRTHTSSSFLRKILFSPLWCDSHSRKCKNVLRNFQRCISGRILNLLIVLKSSSHPIFAKINWSEDASSKILRVNSKMYFQKHPWSHLHGVFIRIDVVFGKSLSILTNIRVIGIVSLRFDSCFPAFLAITWPNVKISIFWKVDSESKFYHVISLKNTRDQKSHI